MNTLPMVFVTPGFKDALLSLNINPIAPMAYDKMRHLVSAQDMAFGLAVDKHVRDHFQVKDLGELSGLYTALAAGTDRKLEFRTHIDPVLNSNSFKEKVFQYLRGEEKNEYMMDSDPSYSLGAISGHVVVGVEQGFFRVMNDKVSARKFYRDCLELCQRTIPSADLQQSDLFKIFVKLSISF